MAVGKNAQIDLLIARSDRSMNICEMKFSVNEFVIVCLGFAAITGSVETCSVTMS